MKKLIFSLIILIGSVARAESTSQECFDIIKVNFSGASIVRYKCTDSDVVIPEEVNGSRIVEVGDHAFEEAALRSVTIPEGVIRIGRFAFFDTGLKTIILPSTLKIIDELAFWNNRIEAIELPVGLEKIGYGAFQINGLRKVTLPDSVTELGYYSFERNLLGAVVLSKNLKVIPEGAFNENSLFSISIPEGVEVIGRQAFNSNRLDKIELPESLKKIEDYAFRSNYLNSVEMPKGIVNIGKGAFLRNQIQKIIIPGLTFIDESFDGDVLVDRVGATYDGYWVLYKNKSEFSGEIVTDNETVQEIVLSDDNRAYMLKETTYEKDGSSQVKFKNNIQSFISPERGEKRVRECVERGGEFSEKVVNGVSLDTCRSGPFTYAPVPFGIYSFESGEGAELVRTQLLLDFGKN